MSKSYKLMNKGELLQEIERVKTLLTTKKDLFSQRQNRKYLERLEKRFWGLETQWKKTKSI